MNYGLNVKQNILMVTTGVFATIALTFLAVRYLEFFLIVAIASALLGIFKLISGPWRRSYVLLIIAMTAGVSHIAPISQIGSIAKLLSLVLLLVVSVFTTNQMERVWTGNLHRYTIGILWIIVALAGLSIVWSESRIESATQSVILGTFVYVLHQVSTTRWNERPVLVGDIGCAYWTMVGLLAVGIILALVGFPEAISSFSGRWQGLYNNPNLLGMLAALTTSLGIGWALHKKSWLVVISILVPLSQVILSESRTALIATVASVGWVLLRGRAKYFAIFVYGFVLVCLVGRALGTSLLSKQSFRRFSAMEGGDLLNSRTSVWSDTVNSLDEQPLGVGWAASTDVLARYRESGIGTGLSSVHNSYLQLIYEVGLIGIIVSVLILAILARAVFFPVESEMQAGLIAAVVSGTIIQFTESAIFGVGQPYPYLYWFAVLACILIHDSNGSVLPSRFKTSKTGV